MGSTITREEKYFLKNYICERGPSMLLLREDHTSGFWWAPGNVEARRDWLANQIKFLTATYSQPKGASLEELIVVDVEFVKEACDNACKLWKLKLKKKFPEIFPSLTPRELKEEELIATVRDKGYKKGNYEILLDDDMDPGRIVPEECYYESSKDTLYTRPMGEGGNALYIGGRWANVYRTITRSEAFNRYGVKVID